MLVYFEISMFVNFCFAFDYYYEFGNTFLPDFDFTPYFCSL